MPKNVQLEPIFACCDKTRMCCNKLQSVLISDKRSDFGLSYSCYLVESFFFAGNVFKEIRGVPMGGNCSPLLSDFFVELRILFYEGVG